MTKYDENLNDRSTEYCNKYYKLYKDWKYNAIIFCGFFLLTLVMYIVVCIKLDNTTNLIKKYEEALIDETQFTSLEYAIGFYSIHEPFDDTINDSILYQFLVENNAYYPEILLNQAKIESANYTSNIFKQNNNLFGMKKAYKRQHIQSHSNNNYAAYKHWRLSVLDRILWDKYYFDTKPTKEEYLTILDYYAQDNNYINKLNCELLKK